MKRKMPALSSIGVQMILYSALNVKGMVKISQRLGFTPVPVDLDVANLKPRMEALEAAVSKKSKVLVIAHLMGTRMDLAPYAKFAKKHNLILVEDCAQVFDGQNYKGAREADICMFSFGPLKTATSLGGALIRVRDKALLEKMRNIQSDYALQTQKAQRKRVFKFMALKIITSPFVMGLIYRFYSSKGENYEDSLSNKVRDVAPLGNSNKLRMRPSLGMLRLLNRRLYTYPSNGLEERTKKGEFLRDQLGGAVVLPGGESSIHSYWVFCLLADDPQTYIDELRKKGFDGANLPRSQAVPAPEGRAHLKAVIADNIVKDIIVVPCYPGMPDAELVRLSDEIKVIAQKTGTKRTKAYAKPGKRNYKVKK